MVFISRIHVLKLPCMKVDLSIITITGVTILVFGMAYAAPPWSDHIKKGILFTIDVNLN